MEREKGGERLKEREVEIDGNREGWREMLRENGGERWKERGRELGERNKRETDTVREQESGFIERRGRRREWNRQSKRARDSPVGFPEVSLSSCHLLVTGTKSPWPGWPARC